MHVQKIRSSIELNNFQDIPNHHPRAHDNELFYVSSSSSI